MPLSPTADVPYGRRWGSASATRHSAGGDRAEPLGDPDQNKDLDHNPPRAKKRCNEPLDIARKLNKFSE